MADQIENPQEVEEVETPEAEAPETDLSDVIGSAVGEESAPEAEEPEAEPVETPEAEVEEDEDLDMGQVIGNAANIALDPDHELYDDAVDVLKEYAPELADRLGLNEEAGEEEFEPEGDSELAALKAEVEEMKRERQEERDAITAEQEAAEEAAAREAFRSDLTAIVGEDAPEDFDQMNPEQQLAAVGLLGLDGLSDNPKEAFTEMLKERDAAIAQRAIDEYVSGKGEARPTPPTGRNASTSTHGAPSIGEIVAGVIPQNGASG